MSMKSENMGVAYFTDGHIEAITDFEISKDYKDIWFTVESGRWFVYREERAYTESGAWYPVYKFYKHSYIRHYDEFGVKWHVEYLVTDEIEKIKICTVE